MKRRPVQQSMLTLMGMPEKPSRRYKRVAHVVPGTDRVDADGNILNVTVCTIEAAHSCDASLDPWYNQEPREGDIHAEEKEESASTGTRRVQAGEAETP